MKETLDVHETKQTEQTQPDTPDMTGVSAERGAVIMAKWALLHQTTKYLDLTEHRTHSTTIVTQIKLDLIFLSLESLPLSCSQLSVEKGRLNM